MDSSVIREFVKTNYWSVIEGYIDLTKEGIKMKLLKEDAGDAIAISFLQGRYDALAALQSLINKHKEE